MVAVTANILTLFRKDFILKICSFCGATISARINIKRAKFCSKVCYYKSLESRRLAFAHDLCAVKRWFFKRVVKDASGCWNWHGQTKENGYGIVASIFEKRRVYAHRAAYRLFNGVWPDDHLLVRHTCDNRKCVNPEHLLIGTHSDNSNDAVERKRICSGERHYARKLTREQVALIRSSTAPHVELAAMFGVNESTILRVRRGETWRS
jgi:hypothetical protein